MEFIVIFIALIAIATLVLYIILGKKRNEDIIYRLRRVHDELNTISRSVITHEKSAVTRDSSLRSLISANEQKIEKTINQSFKNNDGRIGCLEDRLFNEIKTSSSEIQAAIQHSYSELSKNFKSKMANISSDLNELKQNLKSAKDEILGSQTRSFSGIETKISAIKNEEHKFIEYELQNVTKEQANIGKCVLDTAKNINNHISALKPLEELLSKLNTLYNNLISLDKDILNQEKSLTNLVAEHTMILEYTKELQNTSEEIFNLMKLLMMDSIVKQTNPKR